MSKVVEVLGGVSDFYEQYSPALQAVGEGVGGAIVALSGPLWPVVAHSGP